MAANNSANPLVYYIDLSKTYLNHIRWQWHPEIEIIIINHGKADVMVDNAIIHLQPGQGVFINQNVLHAIHPYGEKRNCSLYSLTFNPEFLFSDDALAKKYMTPLTNSGELKTLFLDETTDFTGTLLELASDVIAANAVKGYGYELATRAKLYEFWLMLLESIELRDGKRLAPMPLSLDEQRVKEAICFIEENYASPITLESLASCIHISKSECCRCFKRTLKLTPIEYVMRFRIFAAVRLMHSSEYENSNISDLALSVGFNSVSYFNKTFRKYLKQTPTEYRASFKQATSKDDAGFIVS